MSMKRKVNYINGCVIIDNASIEMLIVHQHFNQPDYSIHSMRFRIIEKNIYHRTKNSNITTPLRRQREHY